MNSLYDYNERELIEDDGSYPPIRHCKTKLQNNKMLIESDYGGGSYDYNWNHIESHILSIPKNFDIGYFHLYVKNMGATGDIVIKNNSYQNLLNNTKQLGVISDGNPVKKVNGHYTREDLLKDVLNLMKEVAEMYGCVWAGKDWKYLSQDEILECCNHQIDCIGNNISYDESHGREVSFGENQNYLLTDIGYIRLD